MATKKAASAAKKSAQKQTTNVTTIKAVESDATMPVATAKKRPTFSLKGAPFVAALIAEFVGTFIFAATIIAGQGQPILVLFALAGIVLTIGVLSGAYVNPALTIAGWVTRRLTTKRALAYIVVQIAGAALAFGLLSAYLHAVPAPTPTAADLYSNTSAPELFKAAALPAGKEWLVFFSEVIGTAIFGFAVAGATREKKERTAAAFTAGLGVFFGLIIAGSAAAYLHANAVLNPAIAVALQVDFMNIWNIAVYALGATLGAVIGFVLYDQLRSAEEQTA